MKRQIFPTASKYRRRTRREFGGETVEYIIVILAVVVIGGGLMGFGNQVSGQIGKTGSSKGKVPDAYSETIGKVYVFDWSKYPTGSYRPRFNGNSLACCAAPYDSSTQIPSLGEGDYASIVFDNELSNIPQGNITYRWFKCAGLGSGAGLVAKELGSTPSLSLSGLQGSCINCEVTLTVNGKSKTFVPKAICNGKVSDGIYVRPRIG